MHTMTTIGYNLFQGKVVLIVMRVLSAKVFKGTNIFKFIIFKVKNIKSEIYQFLRINVNNYCILFLQRSM